MKQKIVIQLSMKRGQKYRTKALKIASGVSGDIEKISLEGDDKDKVVVIGDVDVVELVNLLRKGFGNARLETVGAVEENENNEEEEDDDDKVKDNESCANVEQPIIWPHGWGAPAPCYRQYYYGF